jgi:RNA polymerase sigma-70 factor (sigma-E family)
MGSTRLFEMSGSTGMSKVMAMARSVPSPSFEEYVAARGSALVHLALLLTGDRQRAEDLVQTALGRTWPRWSHIVESGEGSYDAYVRKVLLTTYCSWWRRRWTSEYPTAALPEVAVEGVDVDVDRRRDIVDALAALPRGQRTVVVLRYFYDLTETQTAEALGCSVGTVKTQAARALARLRTSPALTGEGVHDV